MLSRVANIILTSLARAEPLHLKDSSICIAPKANTNTHTYINDPSMNLPLWPSVSNTQWSEKNHIHDPFRFPKDFKYILKPLEKQKEKEKRKNYNMFEIPPGCAHKQPRPNESTGNAIKLY